VGKRLWQVMGLGVVGNRLTPTTHEILERLREEGKILLKIIMLALNGTR